MGGGNGVKGATAGRDPAGHDADAEPVGRLFNSLLRLLTAWTSPPVMKLYMDRAAAAVDPAHFQVLRYVRAAGPLRLRDLAAGTNMTPSNASKIVSELVEAGLVTRTVPADDRRVTLIEATGAGRVAVRHLDRAGREMLGERMAGWSERDVEELTRLLSRLTNGVVEWTSALGGVEPNGSSGGRPPAGSQIRRATAGGR